MTNAGRLSITTVFLGTVIGAGATLSRSAVAAGPSSVIADTAYVVNIEQAALANNDFRRVLFTAPHTQLVLMTLQPGEDIGMEVHEQGDQFIRVEAGNGSAVLDGVTHPLQDGSSVVIPQGVRHNVVNTGSTPLRVYVLYSPPAHPDRTVHRTKREAEAAGHHD